MREESIKSVTLTAQIFGHPITDKYDLTSKEAMDGFLEFVRALVLNNVKIEITYK
jgi:hypothetical protein